MFSSSGKHRHNTLEDMTSLLNMFDYPLGHECPRDSAPLLLEGDASMLPPEPQHGNIEYKLKLINPSPNRLQQLITQMKWRLEEGLGQAVYVIGVEDSGAIPGLTQDEVDSSLETLMIMAKKIGATISIKGERIVENSSGKNRRKAVEVFVQMQCNEEIHADEVRVVVVGGGGSGKSTLIGVLSSGCKDNGKGRARLSLFRHRHEIRTGRTSSSSREIVGFDSNGAPVTYNQYQTPEEICQQSSKIVICIDSCGHRKYFKTTLFSITAMHADYVIIMVNALTGIEENKQQLSLCLALKLPFVIVINKIDLVTSDQCLEQTMSSIKELISSSFCMNKSWLVIEKEEDVLSYWSSPNHNIVPIFLISCVSGVGINHLYSFLSRTKPSLKADLQEKLTKKSTIFQIDETFNIQNVGIVVSGVLSAGLIEEGSELQCGPLDDGSLIDVVVTSLQRFKVNRRHVRPGESSTLAIACQDSDKSAYLEKSIRKGMVLLSKSENNLSSICTFFKASIFLMPNSKEVSIGFQGMLFTNVRQSVTVVAIHKKKSISPNESATVMLHFNKHPEYIHPGYRLLIQQGVTKAVGRVMAVYPQMS